MDTVEFVHPVCEDYTAMMYPSKTPQGVKKYREAKRNLWTGPGKGGCGIWRPVACPECGAADGRDLAHSAGCPTLPDLSRDELIAIARNVEAAWAAKS